MNILIIGHKGYVGSRLFDFLKQYYTNVVGWDYKNSKEERFEDLQYEFLSTFNVVILLAAHSSVNSCRNNFDSLNNNITNVIELAKKLNSNQKFIYMSSSSVYGTCHDKLVQEDEPLVTPHNEYDFSKRVMDEYMMKTDLQYYGLRLGTVNGWSPNMRNELVINAMFNSAKLQGQISVYNPRVYRAILSIIDLCRAIYAIITCPEDKRGIYNITSFNSDMENIGKGISEYLKVPYIIHENEKNFKTSYSFSMAFNKFEETFNFEFTQNLNSIIQDLEQNSSITERNTCRICDNNVTKILDLGQQPLANDYHSDSYGILPEYPLALMLCDNCFHTQLSHNVRPDILYKNYQYVSGTSYTLKKYFEWLANKIDKEISLNLDLPIGKSSENKNILEIACNDGTQLDIFRNLGWTTYGVDPASNIVRNIKKHVVYDDFFNQHFATKFKQLYPNLKLHCIMGQNVIAHLDNVTDFIQACKYLMDDDTLLYLQTSQCNMYKNNEFDTIYHEHHSFYSINSMITLVEKVGLYLKDVEKTDIHGTSFLFTISKTKPNNAEQQAIYDALIEETMNGLHNINFYKNYATNVVELCKDLKNQLNSFKSQGYKIIGYGAAAKGNTLLNYIKFKLDYIVDDCELKWNLYTPGMNIPIYSPLKLKDEVGKILLVPLAWNFFEEISNKVTKLIENNKNVELTFIKYFPNIEIIERLKTPVTVICHFYNEEYLLPFWLNHHKNLFSKGIMIDYASTDNSVEIIRSIVPEWEIVSSRNSDFDSRMCDEEVMDIEKDIQGWKIALNVTEFLSCDLQSLIQVEEDVQSITITCYPMIESYKHETNKEINMNIPLIQQRTFGIKNNSRSTRTLHRAEKGNYCQGRHYNRVSPAIIAHPHEAVILWYGFSPFNNQIIKRKLQIQNRMSLTDKINNRGVEHLVSKQTLIQKFVSNQPYLIDFSKDDVLSSHFKK